MILGNLVDLKALTKYNDGFKYILTCIDNFSKFAWVVPLKDKSAKSIVNAFNIIFKVRIPKKIQTDKGKEFLNKEFSELLKSKNVLIYQLNSEMKACIVERFNRTIKEKMWRYFSKQKTYKYIDILDQLIKNYNNSYHRSIKMSPNQVNFKNAKIVFKNLYGQENDDLNFKYKKGDKVRIVKYKTIFDKGYTPNWSKEIFIVNKIIPRIPPVYEIRDLNDEIIDGVFYEQELQKIYKYDDVYEVEKILKKRIRKGVEEYFVSWKGYPPNFNSWINKDDLIT